MGGVIFSLCVSVHTLTGVPHPRSGWEGVPHPWSELGTPLARTGWGTLWPGLDGGEYPLARTGWGTPPWPGLDGGGVLYWPGLDWVPPSHQYCMGYPSRTGCGYHPPPPTPIRQINIASTCCPAGGIPLAFTQEDFLVLEKKFSANGTIIHLVR